MNHFDFFRDVRHAARTLARKPFFTLSIIFTLAIGIGANTAIFSAVYAVLLRPLPYKDSHRLVAIWGEIKQQPGSKIFASYGDFQQLRNHGQSFEGVAATTWAGSVEQTMTWKGESRSVMAVPVSDNFFSVLGVEPVLGRVFRSEDAQNGCTVVISHALWQRELGRTPDVLTNGLSLNERSCSVAGVMPEGFTFYPRNDGLWILMTPNSNAARSITNSVAIVARLKRAVTRAAAQAEAVALHQAVVDEAPAESWVREMSPITYDLQQEFTWLAGRNLRIGLWMLFAAVGIVLLIACVNIAGLMTSHATESERELAVRAALGSSRSRIVRQLLIESLLLAAGGAIAGGILAATALEYFRAVNPIELPPGNPVALNLVVFAFTALIALLAGLAFGIAPGFKASRLDLNEALKSGGSRIAQNWLSSRSGKALIVGEVALSMMLVMGATLLIQSIHRLGFVPLGFRTDHLFFSEVRLPSTFYGEHEKRAAFYEKLIENLAAVRGIDSVAISSHRPFLGFGSNVVAISGRPAPTVEAGDVWDEQVSPNYFHSMEIPLLRGREFDSRDRQMAEPVVIVNQRFAQQYFPSDDPIGQRIKLGLPNSPNPWLTIVGVVGNMQQTTVYKEMGYEVFPFVYRPVAQQSQASIWLHVRASNDSVDVGSIIRREVKAADSRIPALGSVQTMNDVLSANLSQARFRTALLGGFAALALLLAAIGVYGVLSQTVLQRTREIGIRIALGAETRDVVRLIVVRGFTLAAAGLLAGVATALYFTRYLENMFYEIKATDPVTIGVTTAVLSFVTIAATYLPARRAAKIDPIIALKHE